MRKQFLLALLLVLGSSMLTLGAFFALDIYLQHRFSSAAGMNWRGYRGEVVSSKKTNEKRVVVLGGSTVFGYGVSPTDSFPFLLEKKLRSTTNASVSVVNRGMNMTGSHSFINDLKDYRSLDYDVVILYEGYNDLGENNREGRRNSPLFRLIGYSPILPLIFR